MQWTVQDAMPLHILEAHKWPSEQKPRIPGPSLPSMLMSLYTCLQEVAAVSSKATTLLLMQSSGSCFALAWQHMSFLTISTLSNAAM